MVRGTLLCVMSQRMRRVVIISSIVALLRTTPADRHELISVINDDRHIVDDEAAFNFGYSICKFIWKEMQSQVQQTERSDWCNRIIAMIPRAVAYDTDTMREDMRSIQMHALH